MAKDMGYKVFIWGDELMMKLFVMDDVELVDELKGVFSWEEVWQFVEAWDEGFFVIGGTKEFKNELKCGLSLRGCFYRELDSWKGVFDGCLEVVNGLRVPTILGGNILCVRLKNEPKGLVLGVKDGIPKYRVVGLGDSVVGVERGDVVSPYFGIIGRVFLYEGVEGVVFNFEKDIDLVYGKERL